MGESISQQHPSHFCITSVQHPCNFPSTCLHRLPTPKLPGTDRFLDHFGSPLGPIFCPSWPHLALPDAIFLSFLDRLCPALLLWKALRVDFLQCLPGFSCKSVQHLFQLLCNALRGGLPPPRAPPHLTARTLQSIKSIMLNVFC